MNIIFSKLWLNQACSFTRMCSSKASPMVCVTSICNKVPGKNDMNANIGIYWGKNDELNSYVPYVPPKGEQPNIVKTQLESVSLALRQAIYERKLNEVRIHTDSEFVAKVVNQYLANWRSNGYIKRDGTNVKNREDIEELDRLLQQIKAKVEYVPFYKFEESQNSGGNHVLLRLQEEGTMPEDQKTSFHNDYPSEISTFDGDIDGPTIYVAGQTANSGQRGFLLGGYGIHWANNEVRDNSVRYADFPVTLIRAQLAGILFALQQAIERKKSSVKIVTDCGMFLRHYQNDWKKKDGTPVANYPLFKRIQRCIEKIHVKFVYVPSDVEHPEMNVAMELAEDGLAYPILNHDQIQKLFSGELD